MGMKKNILFFLFLFFVFAMISCNGNNTTSGASIETSTTNDLAQIEQDLLDTSIDYSIFNSSRLTENFLLPKTVGIATVYWSSADPSVITISSEAYEYEGEEYYFATVTRPAGDVNSVFSITGIFMNSGVDVTRKYTVTVIAEDNVSYTSVLPSQWPTENVTLTFWHPYTGVQADLLNDFIEDFETLYPNVTINAVYKTSTDINTQIKANATSGELPTLTVGSLYEFAEYKSLGIAKDMLAYINGGKLYLVNDEIVTPGVDLTDYVTSYLGENTQLLADHYYSFPFYKTSDVMVVNRTVLKEHITEIRAAGISITDEGFLSHEEALTYAELELLTDILVDTNSTNVTTSQCNFLVNYDSASNLFVNASYQWKAPYTDIASNILVDNALTRSMLNYMDSLFQAHTVTLPIQWNQSLGTENFKYGNVCMSVISSTNTEINVPSTSDNLGSLKFGIFDTDYVMIPQFLDSDETTFTINDITYSGRYSTLQNGANIGILSGATDSESFFAWQFIKYLTNTENTTTWALSTTGYLPVRYSAYETDEFQAFLQIALDYWAAEGNPNWSESDSRWDNLYASMAVNVSLNQLDYSKYEPAFVSAPYHESSYVVKQQAGYCMTNIYKDVYSPDDALNYMYNSVKW